MIYLVEQRTFDEQWKGSFELCAQTSTITAGNTVSGVAVGLWGSTQSRPVVVVHPPPQVLASTVETSVGTLSKFAGFFPSNKFSIRSIRSQLCI